MGCSQSTGPLEGPPLLFLASRYPGHWGGQGRGEAGPAHHLGPSPTPIAHPPVSPPPSLLTTITPTAASSAHTVTCSLLLSHCLRHTDPASSAPLTTLAPTASVSVPRQEKSVTSAHAWAQLQLYPPLLLAPGLSGGSSALGPGLAPPRSPLQRTTLRVTASGGGNWGRSLPGWPPLPATLPLPRPGSRREGMCRNAAPVSEHFALTGPHANELTIDSLLLGSRAQDGAKATPPHSQLWQKGGSRK